MKRVSSAVAIGQNKGLRALSLLPQVLKRRGIPVNFVEDMGDMNPSFRTIRFAPGGSFAAREHHIVLEVVEASLGIVTRRKVNISTQRGCILVTVHIREASSSPSIIRVLDPNTMQPIRIWRIRWRIIGLPWACPLNRLNDALVCVQDVGSSARRGSSSGIVPNDHAEADREGFDLIIGWFETVPLLVDHLISQKCGT